MRGFVCNSGISAEDVNWSEVGDCFADRGRDGGFGGDIALDVEDFGIFFLLWAGFEVMSCDVGTVG